MKSYMSLIFIIFCLTLSLAFVLACDDDDDDDDDGGSYAGWSCAEGCSVVYDDCASFVLDYDDNMLTEDECVDFCNEEGGIDACLAGCLEAYEETEDCYALEACIYNCA